MTEIEVKVCSVGANSLKQVASYQDRQKSGDKKKSVKAFSQGPNSDGEEKRFQSTAACNEFTSFELCSHLLITQTEIYQTD